MGRWIVFNLCLFSWAWADQNRIGGDFKLQSVKSTSKGHRLDFVSSTETSRANRVFIETDHVRFDLVVGQVYRISAQLRINPQAKSRPLDLEATQLMVYLPQPQGPTPVWILSVGYQGELKGARLLEMHNPGSDFMVF